MREIIVDNFAGGGGASTGIEMAIGRSVDIAINHDENAIAMHKTNHPDTLHYCESVFEVDPRAATGGLPVAMAWFSPDCRHFSKAKGAKPVEKAIRGLAWVVLRWALDVIWRRWNRANHERGTKLRRGYADFVDQSRLYSGVGGGVGRADP